ncbi:3-deoxy-D-manno-octulosonic acid transferase [Geobacter sp.]|uniref:3-deoxy-D-manno-octulosonic acid transferase n=1 Tax=Geobacter sp. TaxID=46610 RepID=UPI00263350FD|nr:3-deoxy-D-manno-octulosonic acid transferase [Geobacter sp.]
MFYLVYDILLALLAPLIFAYQFYRSLKRGRGVSGFIERFGLIDEERLVPLDGKDVIWIHAVSVGETQAAKPLLKALKDRFPEMRLVLSAVTETGREVAEKIAEVDLCIYFPFDHGFAVKGALRRIKPSLVVIVETEIWPNFIRYARKGGASVVLANGRISDRSFPRYLKLKGLFCPVLAGVDAFCMQSAEDARRISAIGAPAERVFVAGNLKYDIAARTPSGQERDAARGRYHLPSDVPVVVAASTHPGEEEAVVAAYRTLLAQGRRLFLILVPRHPERAGAVSELLSKSGFPHELRSRLSDRSATFGSGEVLIVDTIGELMALYGAADLAFVGGSLVPVGGHNILEPASLGLAMVFGPYMHNFRESAALILERGGAIRIAEGGELAAALQALLDDEEKRGEMGRRGARILEENSGATARHIGVIVDLVNR